MENRYLFGSRILTHIVFWVVYYVLFSIIWVEGDQYYESFGLEFILLPIRISASYFVMYYLMPRFLFRNKEVVFILAYLGTIIIGGILQRVFTYFYYDLLVLRTVTDLFTLPSLIKSTILINTTVLFLSALKVFQHWKLETERSRRHQPESINIRANNRNYRINTDQILFAEGLGNHVIFYMKQEKKLISYISLKQALHELPENFVRCHKSFVINKSEIVSYNAETVEIGGRILPLSRTFQFDF